jgi:cysteinyl-tRNA synthetase
MSLRLFNTLSRSIEPFTPITPGRVSMYTCGPTVWNYAHIGNFRTFLFEDLLRRWLEASQFEVLHLMNLTDVDDRIIREAGANGVGIRQLTEPFAQAFFEDRDFLRIRPAHVYPRATDFVPGMIRLVQGLLDNGTAYQGDDGSVYFSISRFPAYGRLSQLDRRELKSGASGRVTTDEYDKENAQDFALWKAARPEDEAVGAAWDAPFGRGRPGWHLECSAMALDLLKERGWGDVLDIHAGGVDLIFPHHEDEIAQSCAFTGKPMFANYWLHGEFLNVRGTKMSKRFGNITTPRDLKADGVDAGAIRLLLFQTHYRQKLDLTDDSLTAAGRGSRRLGEFVDRLRTYVTSQPEPVGHMATEAERFGKILGHELNFDLNSPNVIGELFSLVSIGNREMDAGNGGAPALLRSVEAANLIFDVLPDDTQRAVVSISASSRGESRASAILTSDTMPAEPSLHQEWATHMAQARLAAKNRREYKEADRVRDLLKAAGWEVRDNKDGTAEVRRIGG